MARGVGVLGAERGAEGIDSAERQRSELALQLTRHSEVAGFAEEVLRVVHLAVLGARRVGYVERGDVEHRARALAVRTRDERSVEVVEAVVVEIFVNGVSHGVTDAEHRAEGVGARTQIGYVAQELQRVSFLLQGIGLGIGRAVYLDGRSLHLDALTRRGRLHQTAVHADAGSRGDELEGVFVEIGQVDDYLYVGGARTVVQRDECHVLVAALGAHPALNGNVAARRARFQNLCNSRSFHVKSFLSSKINLSGPSAPSTPAAAIKPQRYAIICYLSKKKYLCKRYGATHSRGRPRGGG